MMDEVSMEKGGVDIVQQDGTVGRWYELYGNKRRTRFGSSLHNNESVPTAGVERMKKKLKQKQKKHQHLSMKIGTNFFSAPEDLF